MSKHLFSKAWSKSKDHDESHESDSHNPPSDNNAKGLSLKSDSVSSKRHLRFWRNSGSRVSNHTAVLATAVRQSLDISTAISPYVIAGSHQSDSGLDLVVTAIPLSEDKTSTSNDKDDDHLSSAAQQFQYIFESVTFSNAKIYHLPKDSESVTSTPQLAYCLALLYQLFPKESLSEEESAWLIETLEDSDDKKTYERMATNIIRAFIREEPKGLDIIREVASLSAVLGKDEFRGLLEQFLEIIGRSVIIQPNYLIGLSQLLRNAPKDCLTSDDLLQILKILHQRLQSVHIQSTSYFHQLTSTISCVLDSMVDSEVKGLSRERIHEPLSDYLSILKKSTDPVLVYQAAYAYQALQYIPDKGTILTRVFQRTGGVAEGVAGVVSAAKAYNLNTLVESIMEIGRGLNSIGEVINNAINPYQHPRDFLESGSSFLEGQREEFNSSSKGNWYSSLRILDFLIHDGRLLDFEKIIRGAPCKRDPAFQWGVCQRLGSLADMSLWGNDVFKRAVSFLSEIYKEDETWGRNVHIKQWIICILQQLSSSDDIVVVERIQELLAELKTSGDETKQALFDTIPSDYTSATQLSVDIAPKESHLLSRVLNRPDVEKKLKDRSRTVLSNRAQEEEIYISPRAKAGHEAKDNFDLKTFADEFLDSEKKVMLILGASGAGKSVFNKRLEIDLWKKYKKGGVIPLLICLPLIKDPEKDMVSKQLEHFDFAEEEIRELKKHREFIFICDGYDEIQQISNLYNNNRLNELGSWRGKMVISCRTEHLGPGYEDWFQPGDRNSRGMPELFQEAIIVPFSKYQINSYIDSYVSLAKSEWGSDHYKNAISKVPNMQDLVSNPFLLRIAIEVLPEIVGTSHDYTSMKITRVRLYDAFVERWIKRGKNRLIDSDLDTSRKEAFSILSKDGFVRQGIMYLKELSKSIYYYHQGNPIIRYSERRNQENWKQKLFSRGDCQQTLLRESIPMVQNDSVYKFVHKSILEYGMALSIFDPNDSEEDEVEVEVEVEDSWSIDSIEKKVALSDNLHLNSPLREKNFVPHHTVIQFLVERVQEFPKFKEQLLSFVNRSKYDDEVITAAANSITILVKSGVQFNGEDLRDIKVPNADLSYGVFDSARMDRCDLRGANLQHIWIRSADFSNAKMEGASFGELPRLKEEDVVYSCAYSLDGKYFVTGAAGSEDGTISLYDTSDWKRLNMWTGHSSRVYSVAFSASGNQIVSGGDDNILRLWDTSSGINIHSLEGHSESLLGVAYSPNGDLVASGSIDKTVRLWDVDTGECSKILEGHSATVSCVTFSTTGDQLASGCWDFKVRLWDVSNGDCIRVLEGHSHYISCVSYSPKGNQIASGCYDNTARIWDIDSGRCSHVLKDEVGSISGISYSPKGDRLASSSWGKAINIWNAYTGDLVHVLNGHTEAALSVVYSPKGDQIASGSLDRTVRLWNAKSGSAVSAPYHSGNVYAVTYSPKGNRIVSGSWDRTIRIWNATTGVCTNTLQGHSNSVSAVIFSLGEEQIASGSWDGTVRLWDAYNGNCVRILQGHTDQVLSISYSPKGDKIASGSEDRMVRLWDTETGGCIHAFQGHTDVVFCVDYSPNGSYIASGSRDSTVQLWDVDTGHCVHVLKGHTDSVQTVIYSQNEKQIASGSDDTTVRIWNPNDGRCVHILQGHTRWVRSIAYSPNDAQIASASGDRTVRLWDVVTGACIYTLEGHKSDVHVVRYSPKGDKIASGGRDNLAIVWDVKDGACLAVIDGFSQPISCMAWKNVSEELCLVTGSSDRSVREWKITQDGAKYNACLLWSSSHGGLTVLNSIFDRVEGLTDMDEMLLTQHGAIIHS